jgi:Leucine-rich repeat (LRR) protein
MESCRRIIVSKSIKPKRRFFQFSLRSLLVVMLVVCVTLAWKVEKAKKQREAVAWVQESGGSVSYDYEFDDARKRVPNPQPPGPKWLRELVGIDYFDDVVQVRQDKLPHNDITPLAGLTSLVWLDLRGTQVSDVTPLAGLTTLNILSLQKTQVSEEDYKKLQEALPKCNITWSRADESP